MEQFFTLNPFSNIVSILIGGVIAYFTIKYQVTKSLRDTIGIYQAEIQAYKEQSDRNEKEIALLKANYDDVKKKKNYLKQIVIEAMQSKKDLATLLEGALKGTK